MNRDPEDYMSRSKDRSNVSVARLRRVVDGYGTVPGGNIALNPLNWIPTEEELQRKRVAVGLYADWRGDVDSGASLTRVKPTPGMAKAMAPQPMGETEHLGDVARWAGQVTGTGTAFDPEPPPLVKVPGIAAEVARHPDTGQPVGTGLPPAPPAGMEELRSLQPMYAPVAAMQMERMQVRGRLSDARMHRAGRGASPTTGGRPAVMPQPQP